MTVRYTQSCPTCGRRVEVRAYLLGRTIACQHCKAEFVAEAGYVAEMDSSDDLMARANDLLKRTDKATSVG